MSLVNINNYIYLKYNYVIDPLKKYNVVSICLFKMEGPYKDFKKYIDPLYLKIESPELKKSQFKMRLYYDDSVLEDKKVINFIDKLNRTGHQTVHYNCPKYKSKNNKFHNGIFGMFVRYLPFFDYPENDVNYCFVNDADGKLKKLYKYYETINKSNIDMIYTYWFFHNTSHTMIQKNFILGSYFIVKYKFPLNLLLEYIQKTIHKINELYPELYEKLKNKNILKYTYMFFYGSDELFLETVIKKYIHDNNLNVYRFVNWYAGEFNNLLHNIFENILKTNDKKTNEYYSEIFKKINKKYNKNFRNLNDFINFFKDYDWKRKTNMYKIYRCFYKKIIKLYNEHTDLIMPKLDKFVKMRKLYDDTNNFQKIT